MHPVSPNNAISVKQPEQSPATAFSGTLNSGKAYCGKQSAEPAFGSDTYCGKSPENTPSLQFGGKGKKKADDHVRQVTESGGQVTDNLSALSGSTTEALNTLMQLEAHLIALQGIQTGGKGKGGGNAISSQTDVLLPLVRSAKAAVLNTQEPVNKATTGAKRLVELAQQTPVQPKEAKTPKDAITRSKKQAKDDKSILNIVWNPVLWLIKLLGGKGAIRQAARNTLEKDNSD
ncbi:MAG: hypothetical protein VKJ04_08965 [Vampirovibrionales bacterium]|nr:hypothetical protein [Vampirovibrionales bacterium]